MREPIQGCQADSIWPSICHSFLNIVASEYCMRPHTYSLHEEPSKLCFSEVISQTSHDLLLLRVIEKKHKPESTGTGQSRRESGTLLKNNKTNPMKTIATGAFSLWITFMYFKYRIKTIVHSRSLSADVLFSMTFKLKYLIEASLKNHPAVTLIPSWHNTQFYVTPSNQDNVCMGEGGDPADNHLPIDFGSRFLTNSVWSPTCRMLYTLLFISSSWLYLRYCVTFSETNTTLPSRFTTKKNPSRA